VGLVGQSSLAWASKRCHTTPTKKGQIRKKKIPQVLAIRYRISSENCGKELTLATYTVTMQR